MVTTRSSPEDYKRIEKIETVQRELSEIINTLNDKTRDTLSTFQGEIGELKTQVNLLVIATSNASANLGDRGLPKVVDMTTILAVVDRFSNGIVTTQYSPRARDNHRDVSIDIHCSKCQPEPRKALISVFAPPLGILVIVSQKSRN
ncbi:Uncharacterized protein TCM_002781 [Theobroma cacao]|uniref:Uncharacterized protein n=1 Tax=Theobroma cacao TaxID=3641 RepID=A0A061DMA6_THECC|nr:Uncharacterized protein TCM_002781 [Theobroma cacao]